MNFSFGRVLRRALNIPVLVTLVVVTSFPAQAAAAATTSPQVHIVRHGNHHVRSDQQPAAAAQPGAPKPSAPPAAPVATFPFRWAPQLELPPAFNQRTAGTVVTIRFSLGARRGLDILADHSPRSWQIDCTTGARIGGTTFETIPHELDYNSATGYYVYTWVTQEAWSSSCRLFTLALSDGTSHTLRFTFDPLHLVGALQPLPATNIETAGDVIDVAFRLKPDAPAPQDLLAPGYPRTRRVNCATGELVGPSVRSIPLGPNGLTRTGSTFHYAWQTQPGFLGQCRAIQLRLTDGSLLVVRFHFNVPPVAHDDGYATNEDAPLHVTLPTKGVLANDSDPDTAHAQLSATLLSGPAHASSFTLNGDGTFDYTPDASFQDLAAGAHRSDSFRYTVSDGHGGTDTATVHLQVNGRNDKPVAVADSYTTAEDTPLTPTAASGVLANDTDTDTPHASLSAVLVSGPSRASSFTLNPDGSFSYTPLADFNGPDSFSYKANDGATSGNTVIVSLTVNALNDAPVNTLPASFGAEFDTDQALGGISVADVDAGTNPITVELSVLHGTLHVSTTVPSGLGASNITGNGSADVTLSGTLLQIDSTLADPHGLVYHSSSSFSGSSDTLSMTSNDLGNSGAGGPKTDTDSATITIDQPPVAADQSVGNVTEDTPKTITLSATDPDGETLSFHIADAPQHGTVVSAGSVSCVANTCTQQWTYTPAPDYNGADSFTFRANDGFLDSNKGTVSITVQPVNDAPVANDDGWSIAEDNPLSVAAVSGVLANDTDIDTAHSSLTAALVSAPNHASSFTLHADGSFDYSPAADFNGTDTFTYKANDGFLDSNTATVTITVNPVNDAPVITRPASATTNEDTSFTFNGGNTISVSDVDAGSGSLSLTLSVSHGTLTLSGTTGLSVTGNGTGSVTASGSRTDLNAALDNLVYTPTANYNTSDSLAIGVTDNGHTGSGGALTDAKSVSITITPVNDPPVAVADSYSGNEDFTLTENAASGVLANDTDIDTPHTLLTASQVFGPLHASSFNLSPDGSFSYTPTANFNGTDSFSYKVSDGLANSGTVNVTITINPVNDAPTVDPHTFSVPENSANSTAVGTATYSDPDTGQTHTFSIVSGNGTGGGAFAIDPSSGAITVADASQLDFETVPGHAFSLFVRVTDNGSPNLSGSNTVTVNLTNVNDAPVVNALTFSLAENSANTTFVGTATYSDQDLPAQNPTFAITAGNTGGAFAIDPSTGGITVANSSALDFETTPSFSLTVQVTDDGAPPRSGSNTVTVNLSDVNEAPVVPDDTRSIAENSANGTTVGTPIGYTDQDTGQTHTFAITAGNGTGAGAFAINVSTGQITVNDTSQLNHEDQASYSLTVQVTDNGATPLSGSGTITVNVTDVNDAPVVTALSFSLPENSANATAVGSASFTDQDSPPQTHTFAITAGNTGGAFAIDPSTGAITVADSTQLDYENVPGHAFSLTVQVTDNGVPPLSGSNTVTVTLTDANDAPAVDAFTISIPENSANTTLVAIATYSDQDTGQGHTFSITAGNGTGGGAFAIDPSTGHITVADASQLDFETTPTFSLTVQVTDDGAPPMSGSNTVTVNLTNVNEAPVAVADPYSTNEDTPLSVDAASGVLGNDSDVDTAHSSLTAIQVSGPGHASSFTLNGDGSFDYTPAADYNGPDSFSYKANDGSLDSNTVTVSITVNAVNDAPVPTGPATATTDEDTAFTFNGGNTISVSDVDADPGSVQVTLSVAQGTFSLSGTSGLLFSFSDANGTGAGDGTGDAAMIFRGTLANVNAALNGLAYTPAADYNGSDTLSIGVDDLGNTGLGAVLFGSTSVAITINPVNDKPVNTLPASFAAVPAINSPLLGISVADVDAGSDNVTVEFKLSNPGSTVARLTVSTAVSGGVATGDVTNNDSADVTITASLAKINATLADANGLTYNSHGLVGASDTLDMTTNDLGHNGSGGSQSDHDSATIGIDQAPVAGNQSGLTTNEDTAKTITLTASDPDGDAITRFDIVSQPTIGGAISSPITTGISCAGTTPNPCSVDVSYVPNPNANGPDSFTFTANDGTLDSNTATISITVNPVNDAPVLDSAKTPALAAVDEDPGDPVGAVGTLVSSLVDFASPSGQVDNVTDPDTGAQLGIAITGLDGTDFLVQSYTAWYSLDGGSNWTQINPNIEGTADSAALLLAADTDNRIYIEPATNLNGTLSAVVRFRAWDRTSGSDGGVADVSSNGGSTAFSTANDTADLVVNAVNDPEGIHSGSASTNEDTPLTPAGFGDLRVTEVDADPNPIQLSLSVSHGTLSLGTITGLDFSFTPDANGSPAGDGTDDTAMTFRGTITDINAAVNTLVYTPTADYNGPDTLSETDNDLGNTGSGGPKTASGGRTITVNPVNDAPSFTKGADQTVLEDAGAQTVNGWATAISAGPADESAQVVSFAVTGNTTPSLFSVAPAVDGSGNLTYTPAANANGSSTITLHAHDTGGTSSGGVDNSADQTFVINVTAVNDAPSFTKGADQLNKVNQDTSGAIAYTVAGWATAISKGPANESGQTVDFVIDTVSTTNLFTAGPAVAPNGDLTFTTDPAHSGSSTVTLHIHDNGGTLNGGVNVSATQTFTISTVFPAPIATDDGPSTDYAATGGVPIDISAALGVTQNDTLYGGSIASFGKTGTEQTTLGAITATNQGGFVTLNADGSFHYDPPSVPPVGGSDTFVYTLTNNGGSDTATVTIGITNQVIVLDSGFVGTETGSFDHPYNSLTDIPAGRGTGGVLFFYTGDGSAYSRSDANGITLKNSETLIGQGVAISSNLPFSLAPHSVTLPGANTSPTITIGSSLTTGKVIALASGNTIKGIAVATTASGQTGVDDSGASVGALNVLTTDVTGSGQAINLTHGGTGGTAAFGTVSSSGGTTGIALGGALVTTFSATTGTLSGHSGSEFSSNGGSGDVSYGGAIGDGTGTTSVSIVNRTGGTVALTGTITDGNDVNGGIGISGNANTTINFSGTAKTLDTGIGDGVSISNNTGSTVNFTSGGLTVQTSNGTAFQDTVAGTVSVTGSGNTLATSGTGAIVNMSAISLGLNGVTFGSLQSTGVSVSTTAIQLNNVDANTFTSGGVSIAGTTGVTSDGIRINGGSSSTFSFNGTTTISGTGNDGINLSGANGAVSFNSVTLNGMTGDGIDVSGNTNSVTVSGGSIGGTNDPTGDGVNVNTSGSANVSVAASITKTTAGNVVNVSGHTGGTVAFSGAVSGTGAVADGVNLSTNTGATINFSGGLTLTTGANPAFSATGGGTVNVTGSSNTISTTSGTALNIANTTIGSSNLVFQSISANGGTSGIILDTTGASGGLHVTGTGSGFTGGTIQSESSTNGGVYLNSTKDVQLSWMHLTNFPHGAIRGGTINGFSLSNVTINGTEGTDLNTEGDVYLTELTGTSSITSSTLTAAVGDDLNVRNNANATLNLTVTGSTFSNAGDDGITLVGGQNAGDSPTINADISMSTFTGNIARGVQIVTNSAASASVNIGKNGVAGSGGTWGGVPAANLDLAHNSTGDFSFNVENATFTVSSPSTASLPINIFDGSASGSSSTFQGRVINNSITGQNNSCCDGISITGSGPGTETFLVSNNTITNVASRGIVYVGAQNAASNTANLTITNDTITMPDVNSSFGIQVSAIASSGTGGPVVAKALITGNNVVNNPNPRYRVDALKTGATLELPGYGGGASDTTAVKAFVAANNQTNGATAVSADVSASVGLGPGAFGNTPGGLNPTLPSNPNP